RRARAQPRRQDRGVRAWRRRRAHAEPGEPGQAAQAPGARRGHRWHRRAARVAKKQLWIAPVDASAPAHAVTELEGTVAHPQWSPDGKRLAFEVERDTHALTAVLDVDGEAVRWIAPSTDLDVVVTWSPDGKKLAFVRTPVTERKRPIVPVTPSPW